MNHSLLTYDPAALASMTSLNAAAETMMTERHLGIFSPLEITPEAFKKAYELPIGDHVEKNYKGLSYLSWPFAFRYLNEQFPGVFVSFEEQEAGWPVFGREGCWLLRPYLTDGIRRTPALVFPVMDNKHNAVKDLDARQVSDNIQRASVKCIATFTGLGLKLYAGEDIPKADDAPSLPLQQEAPRPAPAAKTAAPSPKEAIGGISEGGFNGKEALLAFCKANPLGKADERASLMLGKNALQALGLAKGEDIQDAEMFANVISTMVTSWTKEEGIKITKVAMAKEIDCLRAACLESVDAAVEWAKAYVEGKK